MSTEGDLLKEVRWKLVVLDLNQPLLISVRRTTRQWVRLLRHLCGDRYSRRIESDTLWPVGRKFNNSRRGRAACSTRMRNKHKLRFWNFPWLLLVSPLDQFGGERNVARLSMGTSLNVMTRCQCIFIVHDCLIPIRESTWMDHQKAFYLAATEVLAISSPFEYRVSRERTRN